MLTRTWPATRVVAPVGAPRPPMPGAEELCFSFVLPATAFFVCVPAAVIAGMALARPAMEPARRGPGAASAARGFSLILPDCPGVFDLPLTLFAPFPRPFDRLVTLFSRLDKLPSSPMEPRSPLPLSWFRMCGRVPVFMVMSSERRNCCPSFGATLDDMRLVGC